MIDVDDTSKAIFENALAVSNTVDNTVGGFATIVDDIIGSNTIVGPSLEMAASSVSAIATILDFAVESGLDIEKYNQWNDNQQKLYLLIQEQGEKNKAFLSELKDTYPNDDILVEYCNDMIRAIELGQSNQALLEWVDAERNGQAYGEILAGNFVEQYGEFSIPVVVGAICNPVGILGAVGALTGFGMEVALGTDTTLDSLEDIDILYTHIQENAEAIEETKNNVSDDVLRFQEFNMLNLKIAGLETASQINKGVDYSALIEEYESYRQALLDD